MAWDETDRAKYAVIRDRYASDLSDEEFVLIDPVLPAPTRRGRKPTDARSILNALFYMIRCGCPWRYLPKDFPPFTTVQNRFYAWRDSGLWDQIVAILVMAAREAEGKEAAPSVVIVDSQSVKTTEAGGPRGGACPRAGEAGPVGRGQEGQGTQATHRGGYPGVADPMRRPPGRRSGSRRPRANPEGGQSKKPMGRGGLRGRRLFRR